MQTPPPGRPNPGRPLDNEPPPLLTYGDGEYDGGPPERRGPRLPKWSWLLLLSLAVAGAAYYFLIGPGAPSASTISGSAEPLPGLPASAGEAMLGATMATDTSVAPGTPVDLVVRATTGGGAMLSDVRVRFEVDRGGGTLSSEEVWTDPGGVARTTLLTPNRPTTVVVRASLEGPGAPATHFTVTTRSGAAAAMTAVQGNAQEQDVGGLLPDRLGVLVTDEEGLPVTGVEVRFQVGQGGGISAPSVTRTDSLGQASAVWRLGPGGGQQTLIATSPELPQSVVFTAMARGAALAPGAAAAADDLAAPSTTTTATPATPPIAVTARDFVVGGSSVCFLVGTRVTCRGANDRGQGIADGAPGARSLAAGLFHACAIDGAGVASCWGANDAGQLGDGSRNDRASAVRVQTDLRFSALAAGVAHTCGLTTGGRAACWGLNLGGQLGDGSRDDRTTPGLVASEVSFVDLVAGWNHTCGVTSGGDLYCWGLNREGAIGDGSQLDRLQPQRITGPVTSVTAGSAHTCAVSGGRALCWGDNRNGQLGDGSTQARTQPTPVSELPGQPTSVAAGAAHSCALLADGSAHCWGQNLHGQLGNGSTAASTLPSPVAGAHRFSRLAAGGGVTCGLGPAGAQHCWGLNQSGQIGDGTFTNRLIPTRVGGG